MYCNNTCRNEFYAQKRGQQLVNDIMNNPRKILDAIPITPRQDPAKLDAIRQKIEEKYFLIKEELPSTISLRFDTEEAQMLNYIVKTLNLPRDNVLKIGMLSIFKRIRELEKDDPHNIMINPQETITQNITTKR
jgi:hypothetical protein